MTADFDILSPALLIRASAGTGKTFALSNRFISLLAAHEQAERILATTFTRKAAAEIQERVYSRLAEAVLSEEKAASLAEHIGKKGFHSEDAARILRSLVQQQHRLNICTLDSLFIRMAAGFSLELGLTPGWTISDEYTRNELVSRAVHAICSTKNIDALAALVRLLSKGDAKRSVHQKLAEEVAKAHELFRKTDFSAWDWLRPPEPLDNQALLKLKAELTHIEIPKTQKNQPHQGWQKSVNTALQDIESEDWLSFISRGLVSAIIEGKKTYSGKEITSYHRRVIEPLIRNASACLLHELREQTLATHQILKIYERSFEELQARQHALSFSDIKFKLAKAAISGDLQDLYYRLDCRIAHLLLDEFQDTSQDEWQILEPMAEEIICKAEGEHSFFCVGDVKQAIYGWRGGVAEIFDSLEKKYQNLKPVSQEMSRRSAGAIIETINQVFGDIEGNPAFAEHTAAAIDWGKRFKRHTTVHKEPSGYVSLTAVKRRAQNEDPSEAIYAITAQTVQTIVSAAPDLSVGILVRKNEAVAQLIFELAKDRYGIAASEEGGNPLTTSPAVSVILSLLTLSEHPEDTIARFHVATSPLGSLVGLTDHSNQAQALKISAEVRAALVKNGYGPTIDAWAQKLVPLCGIRDRRRLGQLVEAAIDFDLAPHIRASRFINLIKNRKVEDPSASNVRVMTIHQAKGLEFDVVILPELDFNLLEVHHTPLMTFRSDPTQPPLRISRSAPKEVRRLEERLVEMHQQNETERLKEALSVLYVAMTRAKQALYMFVSATDKQEEPPLSYPLSYSGILRAALGGPSFEEGLLFERGSPNWLSTLKQPKQESEFLSKELHRQPAAGSGEGYSLQAPQRRSRGLLRETPSGLEGGPQVKLERLLLLNDGLSAKRGEALHCFFSLVGWLDENPPTREELLRALRKIDTSGLNLEQLIDEFCAIIQVEEVRRALSKKNYFCQGQHYDRLEVLNEQRFALRRDNTVFSGALDRLVVCYRREKAVTAEIIDYKTDAISTGDEAALSEKLEFYRPQLELYRQAAAKLTGLEPEKVCTKLLFTALGRLYAI